MKKIILGVGILAFAHTSFAQSDQDTVLVHTVQTKEGLFSIAKKYGVSVQTIQEENLMLDNAISVGNQLKIRINKASLAALQTTKSTTTGGGNGEQISYRIRVDDTLESIAKLYKITPDALKSQNTQIDWAKPPVGELIKFSLGKAENISTTKTEDKAGQKNTTTDKGFEPNTDVAIKYRVRSSDNLRKIAQLYNTTPESIMQNNQNLNNETLRYGDIITIRFEKRK